MMIGFDLFIPKPPALSRYNNGDARFRGLRVSEHHRLV